jgi:hypothetical protein
VYGQAGASGQSAACVVLKVLLAKAAKLGATTDRGRGQGGVLRAAEPEVPNPARENPCAPKGRSGKDELKPPSRAKSVGRPGAIVAAKDVGKSYVPAEDVGKGKGGQGYTDGR